ncbi:MAG: hypothetical protein HUU50_09795 [Candidatus Brocadiae bacterium]|nr:hypothetical protein [Candidatus Brocadiia bacterium]
MRLCFIVCLLFVMPLCFAQLQSMTKVNPSGVNVDLSWVSKTTLDPEAFIASVFKSFQEEYYVESMTKISEEIVETKENKLNSTKSITKKHSFFVRPAIPHYPEALLSFTTIEVYFDKAAIKDINTKVIQQASVTLDQPCQLYSDYFDFVWERFDISTVDFSIKAMSDSTKCMIQASFQFNNLFIVHWLCSARDLLKLDSEPQAHSILLFFKDRFETVTSKLHQTVNK